MLNMINAVYQFKAIHFAQRRQIRLATALNKLQLLLAGNIDSTTEILLAICLHFIVKIIQISDVRRLGKYRWDQQWRHH